MITLEERQKVRQLVTHTGLEGVKKRPLSALSKAKYDVEKGEEAIISSIHTTMSVQLTDLPPELLALILSYLPAKDLLTCDSLNRGFHDMISDSVTLQYNIDLHKACAKDNSHCTLSCSEKLDLLRRKEESWSNCAPSFHHTVGLTFSPGSVYDLSGDVYLLGDHTRQRLQFLQLPNTPDRVPQWSTFGSGDNAHIVDFGLNLLEHDIIALVTAREVYIPPAASPVLAIDLSLRQFSTGKSHPLAKAPLIPVIISQPRWGTPSINLEIVGKYLTLVTTFWRNPNERSRMYVYEWQSGQLVMEINGSPESYSGIVFLSEDIILLPNTESRALEIWKIPQSKEQEPSTPLRKLALPRLLPHNILRFISCRAEPNPVGFDNDVKYSDRPFHYDSFESVVLLHLRVHGIHLSSLFTIFVHRRSLLDLISDQEPPTLDDCGETKPIPWSEWAPPITFCIDLGGSIPSRWITTTCGQRFVVLPGAVDAEEDLDQLDDDGRRKPCPIVVFDFNPYNVRKAERELEEDPQVKKVVNRGKKIMDAQEMFAEEIVSFLPYVVTATRESYRLDGVLMDESNVLGLRTDVDGRIKYVEVLHFG
ncbi:hypothetical protein GYMLUDRAFT_40341 [Collybiopsis luxurians FD-317 M1]|uniref:F-box domain-containing protein n=1 Tax=Collybiopsis luxurians FD-317 M1 TaxID=944289 RepID=A0A0D0D451_9AGAR|nr:hypothetical protein GYMLUDRAFT_40341 [Collybiopsis luxurians FD-317 M1]